MELASLKLFDKDSFVIEINEMESYVKLLEQEFEYRKEHDNLQGFDLSYEGRINDFSNKKSILSIASEISSKKIFLEELRASLLRNKEVIHAEYEEFKVKRSKLFDNLNKISESGYKTEVHKAWFTYLRTNLSIYEKMLVDHSEDKHKITTDTGIKEGIVYFYTQLLYAIDEHQKYRQ